MKFQGFPQMQEVFVHLWILFYLCFKSFNTLQVKCCKKVFDSFAAADFHNITVFTQKVFSSAELTVVIVTHSASVSTSIVDDNQVTHVDFWKFTLNGKLIAVFAERTYNVVNMVFWSVFFAADSYFVIRTVHTRSHKVCHTGICTDIIFITCQA